MSTFRSLLRQPSYVFLTVLTLTIAVGANLLVFTIVNAIWLRPRPVHDPDRLVMIMGANTTLGSSESFWFAELGLQRVRDPRVFERVAGQVMTAGGQSAFNPRVVLEPVGSPVETLGVTSEYFSVLGLPIRGRDFTLDDDRYGATPVAIISDRIWRSAFGARTDIVGTTVPALPMPIQIIGVAPPEFHGARLGEQADLWVPRNLVPFVSSIARTTEGIPGVEEGAAPILGLARLRPGITARQAERLIAEGRTSRFQLVVVPLSEIFGSPNHRTLVISEGRMLRLIGATALLVLIGGCATLMALVFVHYERRRNEFGIRLALGASSSTLAQRLAADLGALVAAGFLGAGVAVTWTLSALPALSLPGGVDLSRLDLQVDWRVVVAGVMATGLTMVVAASLPIRRFTRAGITAVLVSPATTASVSSLRLRKVLLAGHVCATVIVLVAAGLFVRTVEYAFSQGPGFDAERTVFVHVEIGPGSEINAAMRSEVRPRGESFQDQVDRLSASLSAKHRLTAQRILDGLGQFASIQSLALGDAPLGPDQAMSTTQPATVETESVTHSMRMGLARVGPGYLEALGLPVIAGRTLTTGDTREPGQARAVVITASLAASLWPGESPLGRHFQVSTIDNEVVGIIQDFAFGSLRFEPRHVVLSATTLEVAFGRNLHFVARTQDPDSPVERMRQAIREIAPEAIGIHITTGRELIAADLGRERLGAWFFSGFGLVAAVLSTASVFGLVAYSAESRRRELGIRAALGATPWELMRMMMIGGIIPVAIGAALGLIGAMWIGKAAESFLIGVTWFDPLSYVAAGFIMLACAGSAGLMAGWRIRRISPSEALRSE